MRFVVGQYVVVGCCLARVDGMRLDGPHWRYLLSFTDDGEKYWLGDAWLMCVEEWKCWSRLPWFNN
jgi:hypothetical protein